MQIVNTRLTKGFMAIFAPAESLPSPATLMSSHDDDEDEDDDDGGDDDEDEDEFIGWQGRLTHSSELGSCYYVELIQSEL